MSVGVIDLVLLQDGEHFVWNSFVVLSLCSVELSRWLRVYWLEVEVRVERPDEVEICLFADLVEVSIVDVELIDIGLIAIVFV